MFSPFSFSLESSTHRLIMFSEELVKLGNEVSLVLPTYDRHSKMNFSQDSYKGIKLIRPFQLSSAKVELSVLPYFFSSTLKQLEMDYDVVHILKPLPITCSPYLLKPLKRAPIIQDMDDLDHNVMATEKHSLINVKLVQYCETVLPKLSSQIVTCSSYLKQIYLSMGFSEGKITWIPNGVKIADFKVDPKKTMRNDYGLRRKVIVYMGSLNNQVQIYPLIKAMETITKERTDVSCLIIGDGTARPYFEELTRNLHLTDFIKFAGRIPYSEVPSYLSAADIGFACFPPPLTSAGGALKVFMYMASGLPVVVNPIGDLPYYIDYGRAGALSNLDATSLSKTFLDLLKDEKVLRQKSQNALTYVKQNFDWSVLTRKLVSVYENLVN
jgi:glycosyltransferase involved in cell wall biosynthesis